MTPLKIRKLVQLPSVKFFDFFYDDERYADYMVFEGFLPTTQTAADLLAKDDDTFASWIDILQSCNFYPATKTEWADDKQGVIEVEQNALLGDDRSDTSG